MAYELIWKESGLEWIYSGQLTGAEIIKSNNAIYGDERFDDMRYQIVDLSAVESFKVSDYDLKYVAALDRAAAKSNPNVRVAIIATSESSRDVASIYGKYSVNSVWESAIFDSREAALDWLEL